MARRPRAVRLGIPALFVAILTFVALWRIGAPMTPTDSATGSNRATPLGPLTQLADVLTENSIGRQASLEHVVIREVSSPRTLWIGTDHERVFVVLDPDVKNPDAVALQTGSRVNLLGLVRAAPREDVAMRQWALDASTAKAVREHGTYLHVTEIRPAS
jgi:hypothetical protein